mgnify:CR=1 FL=1
MAAMTRQRRKRRSILPVALAVMLAAAAAAVLLVLVYRSLRPAARWETPDPHAGQIYVNDGANMVWLTPHDNFAVSPLHRWQFVTLEERPWYAGSEFTVRRGVDLSVFQKNVDWAKAAESGVEFAVIRLGFRGYGKGVLQPDDLFDSHLEGAHAAGIDAGVYFFSQALTAEEGREEAQYVLERLDGRALELPVYFDWEPVSAEDSRTNGYDYANLTDSAVAFCQTIEAAGYRAGVYINRQQGYYHYDLSRLADYSLWVADYNSYPDFYYRFDMWQYTASGQVEGFDIQVDENLLFVPKN